ncbi:MAG: putative selenium-dependent hydroxylase accessory protein YqeC, partial [Desulfobacterales bacterium]|nr:putative selenium-dependent hydroxylase accessory protein YqeC [Desulfobacterales bacterium]
VVGGGGKTSLIFTLAREAAEMGKSVLVTTTTAMFNPKQIAREQSRDYHRLYTGPADDLPGHACEPGGILLAAAGINPEKKKLLGYTPQELQATFSATAFDLILIESDGARMRPVKAPADHEPVVPRETDTLIGCIGMDCLDHPIDEPYVHRPELLAEIGGQVVGDPLTEKTVVRLAGSAQGIFKPAYKDGSGGMMNILVLNKANSPDLITRGKRIGETIVRGGLADHCLITCFKDTPNPVKAHIAG